jgi:hypothetical protein
MQNILKLKKIKKQVFFKRIIFSTLKKKIVKTQLQISSNRIVGSCVRIKFVANNIYCTF